MEVPRTLFARCTYSSWIGSCLHPSAMKEHAAPLQPVTAALGLPTRRLAPLEGAAGHPPAGGRGKDHGQHRPIMASQSVQLSGVAKFCN